ncbi:MAG TPA: hypothetical protein VFS95_08370 [Telluria sp.]|nr:hypothetical protein [Telluria sp.]
MSLALAQLHASRQRQAWRAAPGHRLLLHGCIHVDSLKMVLFVERVEALSHDKMEKTSVFHDLFAQGANKTLQEDIFATHANVFRRERVSCRHA